MRKITRMDDFEIDEMSSVDEPAQQPARALIVKAAQNEDLMKRLRLTSVEAGHQHTLDTGEEGRTSYDHAKDEEFGHSHPVVKNDDGTITLGMADGHTHTVIEKRFTADEALAMLPGEPASSGGGQNTGEAPMTKTAEEIAAEAEAVEKRIADAEARAEKAEQLASMTDVQKAHYGTLSPEAQAEFLGASPDVRQGAVEKAAGEDPVVYQTLDGTDIRKSAGELVLSLAKRADESEKALAVEKSAREYQAFAKRASAELGNLPGDESAQVALLKAIDGIPTADDKAGALEILKAANEGITKAFDTAGTTTGGDEAKDAEAKLEKMAQDHFANAGKDGSFEKSYKAVLETPEGRKLYHASRA